MPGFSDGWLGVPSRPGKPRQVGLTHVMDKGLNIRDIEGMFDTAGDFVDIVKFGWGTSYVTNNLEKKIALYRSFDTPVVCGGTLFEAVYGRDKMDEFKKWLKEFRFSHVEISDGTLEIPRERKLDDGRYEKVCIGTTTSARMVRFTEPLGAQYGVRAICGKGGFPDEAIEPMRKQGMVYFAIVGGAAALETTQIEEIEEVAWEELMPECLWKFRVKDFGPLTVGIDAHGNSLYHDVQESAQEKLKEIFARL